MSVGFDIVLHEKLKQKLRKPRARARFEWSIIPGCRANSATPIGWACAGKEVVKESFPYKCFHQWCGDKMQECVTGFAGTQLGPIIKMEEGQGDWKRVEIFICVMIEGWWSVKYEVPVHVLALIKKILAVRCESSFRNNSWRKKIWLK